MKSIRSFYAAVCFAVVGFVAAANAEGGDKKPAGAFGVNRIVTTPAGYTEVGGNVSLNFQLPKHPNGTAQDDGGTFDEYRGIYTDIPQFYLGSADRNAAGAPNNSIDTGLSWGYIGPNINKLAYSSNQTHNGATMMEPVLDLRRNRGWRFFFRITGSVRPVPVVPVPNPTPTATPIVLNHEDGQIKIWVWDSQLRERRDYRTNFNRTAAFTGLRHTVYERNDPATTIPEVVGAASLTIRFSDFADPAGEHRIYSRAIGVGVAPYRFRTTLVGTHSGTSNSITVASIRDFAVSTISNPLDVIIGNNINRRVASIDYNTNRITFAPGVTLGATVAGGTTITQDLDPAQAYNSHPVAPWHGDALYAANINQLRMRRVVAMTRLNANAELDGSTLRCDFSMGVVKPFGAAFASRAWGTADAEQGANTADQVIAADNNVANASLRRTTGYDARPNLPNNSLLHWDGRWQESPAGGLSATNKWHLSGSSRTTVEFPSTNAGNIEARRNTAASQRATQGGITRYQQETVLINLRRVVRPVGGALTFTPR